MPFENSIAFDRMNTLDNNVFKQNQSGWILKISTEKYQLHENIIIC